MCSSNKMGLDLQSHKQKPECMLEMSFQATVAPVVISNCYWKYNRHYSSRISEPKWSCAESKLNMDCECENKTQQCRCQNCRTPRVTNMGTETLGNDETRARMSRYTAYLPLQHQLFGEQHGLVTEGFSHLHPSRHIPGTAWTFNT